MLNKIRLLLFYVIYTCRIDVIPVDELITSSDKIDGVITLTSNFVELISDQLNIK